MDGLEEKEEGQSQSKIQRRLNTSESEMIGTDCMRLPYFVDAGNFEACLACTLLGSDGRTPDARLACCFVPAVISANPFDPASSFPIVSSLEFKVDVSLKASPPCPPDCPRPERVVKASGGKDCVDDRDFSWFNKGDPRLS